MSLIVNFSRLVTWTLTNCSMAISSYLACKSMNIAMITSMYTRVARRVQNDIRITGHVLLKKSINLGNNEYV